MICWREFSLPHHLQRLRESMHDLLVRCLWQRHLLAEIEVNIGTNSIYFDGIGGFVIYADVSYTWLECVIMQYWKVVAYDLRQLKDHEKNYSTQWSRIDGDLTLKI